MSETSAVLRDAFVAISLWRVAPPAIQRSPALENALPDHAREGQGACPDLILRGAAEHGIVERIEPGPQRRSPEERRSMIEQAVHEPQCATGEHEHDVAASALPAIPGALDH